MMTDPEQHELLRVLDQEWTLEFEVRRSSLPGTGDARMEATRQSTQTDSEQQLAQIGRRSTGSGQERRAIFLDRDGVINVKRTGYVMSWEQFEFLPGARAAIRQLTHLGWPIVLVTNQSAVGRGMLSADGLAQIHKRLVAEVRQASGRIDLIVHCPHTPETGCACRKPKVGLFHDAARRLHVTLAARYFIGDAPTDLAAAQQLGMTFVLVRTGLGARSLAQNPGLEQQANWVAASIADASQWILEREGPRADARVGKRTA